MIKQSKAYKYASWCLEDENRKVPKYVKLQAADWIKIADGEDEVAIVDEESFEKICNLLRLMIHPDLKVTMYEGLEDYAWFFITATLCTKYKDNRNVRFYTTAVLEIARKNFKTFNSAVIFIILLLTEPEFSRFFSVAPDLSLSSELKLAVRKIIKSSPALMDEEDPAFKILRSEIICRLNENTYTPLAYGKDNMDGKQANAFLADEAGALDEYPVEAMRSSQIMLENKLGIIISTQYPNDNNVMTDEIDIAKKTLDKLLEDRTTFALLYEPDEEFQQGDEWKSNDLCIYQSNPVTVDHERVFEDLVKKRQMAVLYENKRENYLCKHNNIKYKGLGVEGYIDIQKVRRCRTEKNKDFWRGKRVWIGLDLSESDDNTAAVMGTEFENEIYVQAFGFTPEDRIEIKSHKERVDYKRLIRNGDCFACGDEVIDYLQVGHFIAEKLREEYGVEIQQVGYDRWNALATIQSLEADGIECVEIRQHSSVLHAPTKWTRELILKRQLKYFENQMLEINFQNARCTEDTNKNKYVNKKKSTGKVDMVVALLNMMYLIQQHKINGDDFVVQIA